MSQENNPSPEHMRTAMENYIRFFNERRLDELLSLYAEDATVEDPVGTPVKRGHAELREFYAFAVGSGAVLQLLAPVRGSMSNEAAMAFDVQLNMEGMQRTYQVIDVMTFDAEGRFASMRAYWGPLNVVGD